MDPLKEFKKIGKKYEESVCGTILDLTQPEQFPNLEPGNKSLAYLTVNRVVENAQANKVEFCRRETCSHSEGDWCTHLACDCKYDEKQQATVKYVYRLRRLGYDLYSGITVRDNNDQLVNNVFVEICNTMYPVSSLGDDWIPIAHWSDVYIVVCVDESIGDNPFTITFKQITVDRSIFHQYCAEQDKIEQQIMAAAI